MHILALDTTTREGSIAVARDGSLLHQHVGNPALTHGQRLPEDLMRALQRAGVRVDDLDLLAVAAGPGSFTGLRVGVAAVQGLAMARGLTVVAVPTLDALARAAAFADHTRAASADTTDVASAFRRKEADQIIAAWMDGQRGEVFGAMYTVLPPKSGNKVLPPEADNQVLLPAGGSREREGPIVGRPEVVLDAWAPTLTTAEAAASPILFIGDGAVRYQRLLDARLGSRARILEPPPLAAVIARIAFEEPHRAVEPHAIAPVYVRRSDAELARDRRQGRA